MFREMLKSKIHRATVTETDINYVGSITIDKRLLLAADILPYEKVHVVNVTTGARFETYAMETDIEGQVCLNGAAARLAEPGDKVIIMAYGQYEDSEIKDFKPKVVLVHDSHNRL